MVQSEIQRYLSDPDYLVKRYFLQKKFCMAFNSSECNGDIVRSHIISSSYLKNIATNNHVYDIQYSHYNEQRYAELKLDGIKNPNILRARVLLWLNSK
jgi:hypothetical protein